MNVHGSISLILLRWRYLGKERERLSIRVPSEFCKIKRSIRYKGMTTSGQWPNPWCQCFWNMGTSFTISHPLSRTSFFLLLDRGGEKEALPEVAVARTSGVVNVRASRASVYWRANGHNWARCTKRTDCILATCSTTYSACSKKILLDSGKLLGGWLFHRALIKQRHSRWHHLLISVGSAFVLEAKYSFLFLLIHNWIPETMFVSNEYHYLSLLLLLKYFEKWKCLKPRFFLPRGL